MHALADKVHTQTRSAMHTVIRTPYHGHIIQLCATATCTLLASACIEPSLHLFLETFYGDLFLFFFDCSNILCSTISPAHAPAVMIIASLHVRIHGQLKWHL